MLIVSLLLTAVVLTSLSVRLGSVPPIGVLLDPRDGLFHTARTATHAAHTSVGLDALADTVVVIRDARGVPHVFAKHDLDAITALGFVTAQDRLFQMDFLRRVGSGRLSEAMGRETVDTDRFLRQIGMEWGARANARQATSEAGVEARLASAYHEGVNAYLATLRTKDLPLEFRLLGYRPAPFELADLYRLLQFMTYDLTFRTDDPGYATLLRQLGEEDFEQLYPRHAPIQRPIIPTAADGPIVGGTERSPGISRALPPGRTVPMGAAAHPIAAGFRQGKGSNAWAANGSRSVTGGALLASDIHLSLTLPAVWYEVHLVSPSFDTYGVVVPGSPLPVSGFNRRVAWSFTNTGADQIDYHWLERDGSGSSYRYGGKWHPVQAVPDTIHVRDRPSVIDTLHYSVLGPVEIREEGMLAVQWVGHLRSRTLSAFWGLNRARNVREAEEALRNWDTPLQNVHIADVEGNIGVRVAGLMPLREVHTARGMHKGEPEVGKWTGRIPFPEMPRVLNPGQEYLASANQEPVGPDYPYYLGFDWREPYRAMRLNQLLAEGGPHSAEDFRRMQSDVRVVQHAFMRPVLDTLKGLNPRADSLRTLLVGWNGSSHVESSEALVLDELLLALPGLVWDEPEFGPEAGLERVEEVRISTRRDGRSVPARLPIPSEMVLFGLMADEPGSKWFDRQATAEREHAGDVLRLALERVAQSLERRYGWNPGSWRWGDHHRVVFPHLTRSAALKALWRGPSEIPGFAGTVAPAGDRLNTHGASWRMVVDLAASPPTGYGIYPGGQSGNPFSEQYDLHLPAYLAFDHYELLRPESPSAMDPEDRRAVLVLFPTESR